MLRSLQCCRALAALLVVFFHASHGIFRLDKYFGHKPFGPVFDFGYAGVDFFFVLSGFIMVHVHASDFGRPHALPRYLWKRFTRIYPAYWVVLLVILPVFFLVPSFGFGFERDFDVVWRSVLLFPHPQTHLVLGVAWTLVYEVFFYALFAIMILNGRLGAAVFAGWTACVLAHAWFIDFPWSFLFSGMHIRFLAGMAVAFALKRWTLPWPRLMACVGGAIFVGAGLADVYWAPLTPLGKTVGFALGSALALAGLVQAERLALADWPEWLVGLGNASYAIYLVHFLALSMLAKTAKLLQLDTHMPSSLLFAAHVVGAVGAGCLFHITIERPLHDWTRRIGARFDAAPAKTAIPALSKAA